MSSSEFIGARLDRETLKMIEQTAKENQIDKTKALKELIRIGRKNILIEKNIELYRRGLCSIDKAAKETGITITEMMQEAVKAGIKSDQTIEEYQRGLRLLE